MKNLHFEILNECEKFPTKTVSFFMDSYPSAKEIIVSLLDRGFLIKEFDDINKKYLLFITESGSNILEEYCFACECVPCDCDWGN